MTPNSTCPDARRPTGASRRSTGRARKANTRKRTATGTARSRSTSRPRTRSARNCKIILVEAKGESLPRPPGRRGRPRCGWAPRDLELVGRRAETSATARSLNHPGVVIVVVHGRRRLPNWETHERWVRAPRTTRRSSPHVVAAGGTRLKEGRIGERSGSGETVWNDGGSEGRPMERAAGAAAANTSPRSRGSRRSPDWSEVGCPENKRAAADVAADADPFTGVAITIDLYPPAGRAWGQVGGTSLASPIIASTFALAGGSGRRQLPRADALLPPRRKLAARRRLGRERRSARSPTIRNGEVRLRHAETVRTVQRRMLPKNSSACRPGLRRPLRSRDTRWPGRVQPAAADRHGGGTRRRQHRRRAQRHGEGTHLSGASAVEFGAPASEDPVRLGDRNNRQGPLHAEGKVDIAVSNAGRDQRECPADEYTYVIPPPPTSRRRTHRRQHRRRRTVKITGEHLEDASDVEFRRGERERSHEISQTEITVKTPAQSGRKST